MKHYKKTSLCILVLVAYFSLSYAQETAEKPSDLGDHVEIYETFSMQNTKRVFCHNLPDCAC